MEAIRSGGAPAYVPSDRVVDVDIYKMPGAEEDLQSGWKALQDSSSAGLFWTPRNDGHWIVTRGRDIASIYADYENFSSNITIVPRRFGEQFPLRPTTLDPPAHRPFRRRLNAALASSVVRAAQPKITELASAAVERLLPLGHCDLIADFAVRLPLALFLHLADLPDETAALPGYMESPLRADGTLVDTPIMDRYAAYLRPYVAERRRRPGSDALSALVAGVVDDGALTEDEAVELATAFLTGGLDTVTSTLGLVMSFLARSPAHRRRLVADPSLIRQAIAELLRRFPIMTKARLVVRDYQIEGVTLKAGDMVVLPPLHGLDEREFADPLTVDFDRPPAAHSTFGNGVHRCPGALLTQLELETVVAEWLARIPEFALDPTLPSRMQGGILGAVLQLGLRWDPAGAARASY